MRPILLFLALAAILAGCGAKDVRDMKYVELEAMPDAEAKRLTNSLSNDEAFQCELGYVIVQRAEGLDSGKGMTIRELIEIGEQFHEGSSVD